jgi:hypothetical protein
MALRYFGSEVAMQWFRLPLFKSWKVADATNTKGVLLCEFAAGKVAEDESHQLSGFIRTPSQAYKPLHNPSPPSKKRALSSSQPQAKTLLSLFAIFPCISLPP